VTPVLQAVVVRFVLQAALSAAAIAALRRGRLRAGATWLGRRENRARIFWRGAWGIGGLVGWFATLSSLSLSDATAIVYVNVPLAAIFAALLLGEPSLRFRSLASLFPSLLLQRRATLRVRRLLVGVPACAPRLCLLLLQVLDALGGEEKPPVVLGKGLGRLLERVDGALVLERRELRHVG
jgi:hypothetical protein